MNTPHFLKGMTGFYAESSSANGHTANARILTLTAYGNVQSNSIYYLIYDPKGPLYNTAV